MTTPLVHSSPRTPSEPMAFTNDELLRGAFSAWVVFMALLLLTPPLSAVTSAMLAGWSPLILGVIGYVLLIDGFVLVIGGIISAIVMALGLPLAKALGRLLRRVRGLWAHLLAYSALGLVIGVAYIAVVTGGQPFAALTWASLFVLVPAIAAVIAVPAGWWWTARLALREDRGLRVRPRRRPRRDADADAVAEDAAIDADPGDAGRISPH